MRHWRQLDPIDREILALRYFDGLNFAQIGAILGLSQNAATKRGLRAMVELRDLIPPAYRPPGASQTMNPTTLHRRSEHSDSSPSPGTPRAVRARAAPGRRSRGRGGALPEAIPGAGGDVSQAGRSDGDAPGHPGAPALRDARPGRTKPRIPERFGPYRVVRSIGRGGMGEVYEAVEEPLGRHVAIKTLRRDATSESLLLRFDRERRTLARLHHTNVVPIYATGSEGDLLYFAMPYLAGASLGQVIKTARSHELSGNGLSSSSFEDLVHEAHSKTQSASDQPEASGTAAPGSPASESPPATAPSPGTHHLSKAYIRTAVQVMATVAEGLHHAHEAGVIHRDLKPANIIVESDGHAWVLDFGLAALKATSAAAPVAFAIPLPASESRRRP